MPHIRLAALSVSVLMLGATAQAATGHQLMLRQNAGGLQLTDQRTGVVRPVSASNGEVVVAGADDANDTLTIDFSTGAMPGAIRYSGGARGYDSLVIKGAGGAASTSPMRAPSVQEPLSSVAVRGRRRFISTDWSRCWSPAWRACDSRRRTAMTSS